MSKSAFYRRDYGKVSLPSFKIALPGGNILTAENYSGENLPEGFFHSDEKPEDVNFSGFRLRLKVVDELLELVETADFDIVEEVNKLIDDNSEEVVQFVRNGNSNLKNLIENSKLKWLDIKNADGITVRQIILDKIAPFTVTK